VIDFQKILSAEENSRAEAFHFDKDKRQFIVSRGLLRTIIGLYLSADPKHILFSYNPHGKPFIEQDQSKTNFKFNLSHSGGLCLFAFTSGREIGIDLERIRPIKDAVRIAKRFFTEKEFDCINGLPTGLQEEIFFKFWTHKEAYLKAVGEGLSLPLNLVEFTLSSGKSGMVLKNISLEGSHEWAIKEINPARGYVAAIAYKGPEVNLKFFKWLD
jgi:4'-phosphopantetheinyl transferase